ncbi:MAG: hypothetical protein ABI878_09740 [Acidobacteriota bacterium]
MIKKLISMLAIAVCSIAPVAGQTTDRRALMLAETISSAFGNGLTSLDRQNLLRGHLKLTKQYDITDGDQPEFESKTFTSFAAMERWLKKEENEPGFPVRMSGEKVTCRRGICRLDLVDNQMAHNHVFLTRIYYGYSGGRIYVKRLRILYG